MFSMRWILTRGALLTGALLCGVSAMSFTASADETKTDVAASAQTNAPVTTIATSETPQSPSWLNERGTITTEQVIQELGITLTPEQRAQTEKAVQKRNRALQEANADLSASLSKTLATNDNELAKRVAEQRERRRMEIIRSRQPGRYNGMKK
jgi:Spy/CpxP family protein refolding chaperone